MSLLGGGGGGLCGVSLLGANTHTGGVVVKGSHKAHPRSKTNATTDPERVFGKNKLTAV